MNAYSVIFPHLGIRLPHVGQSFAIGSFQIMYYGIIVAFGMIAGVMLAMWIAEKTGQDPDLYYRFALLGLILGVFGARVYYVIFSLDYYLLHPDEILDIHGGGLAIYGGIIAGVLTALLFCRRRKISPAVFLDTALPAVALGQAIGRWGNFFNREAFGRYTDSLFAMQLPLQAVSRSDVTQEMLAHVAYIDGTEFIQVHPTFLYESCWNICLLLLLLLATFYFKRRRRGDVALLYVIGYAAGRTWIEGLRTDQLLVPGTGLAVSQVLSVALFLAGIVFYLDRRHASA